MNKENAKDYLPLVQALAEGKTIQRIYGRDYEWTDVGEINFEIPVSWHRIKPEQKKQWYRVALFKDGLTDTADNLMHEVIFKDHKNFVRWLTDRIEYTLPEGDA
ncbi:hypothetical protein [Undibacterium baiyunense]|uniref:Uncharacterized protein n=1 Tax=Undibacterium baiyunense TaxID=2828731 RepID=A0A941I3H5_9BURK|nr:hypothetical protein [Undibacterium baiyunense]MBR7747442.1 hypothetical protein [Undibacterium baiyunense]